MDETTAEPTLVRFTLTNGTAADVRLLWVNAETQEEVAYSVLPAGQTLTQETFVGDKWRCKALPGGTTLAECKFYADATFCVGVPGPSDAKTRDGGSSTSSSSAETSATLPDGEAEAFYHHTLAVGMGGLSIRAHESVSLEAVGGAAEIVRAMLSHSPPDVLERLQAARCTVAVIGRAQLTSDVPEHAFLSGAAKHGDWTYDATTRGVGGNPGVAVTSVGEENLLEDEVETSAVTSAKQSEKAEAATDAAMEGAPAAVAAAGVASMEVDSCATVEDATECYCVCCGAPAPSPATRLRRLRQRDPYPYESILVHEFAHCVMDVGLDDEARGRIRAAYAAALRRGIVDQQSYMGSNASEYWAEAAQVCVGLAGRAVPECRLACPC